jgi:hypothetical protein
MAPLTPDLSTPTVSDVRDHASSDKNAIADLTVECLITDVAAGSSRRDRQRPQTPQVQPRWLPKGSAAIVLIIEHRWALPLQYAVIDAGGFHIADAWKTSGGRRGARSG